MYYVANLKTQSIITYREGDRIIYGSDEAALNAAVIAQEITGDEFAVVPMADTRTDSLKRTVAPWYKIQRKIEGVN